MLAADRKALRAAARDIRRCAGPAAALAACQAALAGPLAEPLTKLQNIAAYWPLGDELDVRPLLLAAAECGVAALPVVPDQPGPLAFRRWVPGLTLVSGRLGTWEPPAEAEPVVPAVLVIPLLAFDRRGHRLGQGGGYYDRTLAVLRAATEDGAGAKNGCPPVAVGIAFACQEIPAVPVAPHDQGLDWVVTEQGAMDCRGTRTCG